MKQLAITRDQLILPTVWEPTGKSPGNTPQAKLQAAQLLAQMGVNPATGIDMWEVARALIANGPLQNAGNIQISKETMEANAAAAQQAQGAGVPGGPGTGAPVPSQAGGGIAPIPAHEGVQPPHGGLPATSLLEGPGSSIQGPGSL